jgi:hypothetical protein
VHYYGYRYYYPVWGRFVNRDPIGEWDGVDAYLFVRNATVSRIDYLGLLELLPGMEPSPEFKEEAEAEAAFISKLDLTKYADVTVYAGSGQIKSGSAVGSGFGWKAGTFLENIKGEVKVENGGTAKVMARPNCGLFILVQVLPSRLFPVGTWETLEIKDPWTHRRNSYRNPSRRFAGVTSPIEIYPMVSSSAEPGISERGFHSEINRDAIVKGDTASAHSYMRMWTPFLFSSPHRQLSTWRIDRYRPPGFVTPESVGLTAQNSIHYYDFVYFSELGRKDLKSYNVWIDMRAAGVGGFSSRIESVYKSTIQIVD